MPDPFTALGVAGNIIQFVDFSCKLVRNACTIAKSATGASESTVNLTVVAKEVSRLCDAIDNSSSYPPYLTSLIAQCKSRANELLETLNRLRTEGKHTKWKSFLVALKEIWKQEEIERFIQGLTTLQNQMVVTLQVLLTERHSIVLQELSALKDESRRLNLAIPDAIDTLRVSLVVELDKPKSEVKESVRDLVKSTRTATDSSSQRESIPSLDNLCKAFAELEVETISVARNYGLLKSLYFPRFASRQDKIEEAHEKTFAWVFDNQLPDSVQAPHFFDWLRSGTGIFWVRGKAGAGKSTLMKYICRHSATKELLSLWAGHNELVVAKYYFWNAGTDLQKSQEGLLRTLLFDILNISNELIPFVQQRVYDRFSENDYMSLEEPWTDIKKLVKICIELVERCQDKRFCFFINGLDEFKGDSDALIQLIEQLSRCTNVKLCVSSRPWTQFVDAFGQNTDKLIKLEDLTRKDIANYTTERLHLNVKFCKMKDLDERYELLVQEVVVRAQGVFLWVYLVLRLETFPPDLDDYFRHILRDIPQIYRHKTAQVFSLATASSAPLPLMIYSFADDLGRYPRFAIEAKTRSMSDSEILQRNEQLPPRLDGRSKGLLEVVMASGDLTYFRYEVEFLHRTVRDFLRALDIQKMFEQALDDSYNPGRILCNAHLAMIKMAPRWANEMNDDRLSNVVEGFFQFAGQLPQKMDYLDDLIDTICEAKATLMGPGHTRLQLENDPKIEFIIKAIHAGLVGYVDSTLHSLKSRSKRPFLEYALHLPWKKKSFGSEWELSPAMVSCLLKHGESPNKRGRSSTIWIDFLRNLQEYPTRRTRDAFEICKILIIQGAAHLSVGFSELSVYRFNDDPKAKHEAMTEIKRPASFPEDDSYPDEAHPDLAYPDQAYPIVNMVDPKATKEKYNSLKKLDKKPAPQTPLDVLRRIAPKSDVEYILRNATEKVSFKRGVSANDEDDIISLLQLY